MFTVHFDMYSESCLAVKRAISTSKSGILRNKISDCKIVDTLIGRTNKLHYLSMIHLSL